MGMLAAHVRRAPGAQKCIAEVHGGNTFKGEEREGSRRARQNPVSECGSSFSTVYIFFLFFFLSIVAFDAVSAAVRFPSLCFGFVPPSPSLDARKTTVVSEKQRRRVSLERDRAQ